MNETTEYESWEFEPDKVDRVLMAGAGFDWITPLFGLFSGARGRTEHFAVPQEWFYFVDDTLDQAGIEMLRHQFEGGNLIFDIRKRDAQRAADLLGLVRK